VSPVAKCKLLGFVGAEPFTPENGCLFCHPTKKVKMLKELILCYSAIKPPVNCIV